MTMGTAVAAPVAEKKASPSLAHDSPSGAGYSPDLDGGSPDGVPLFLQRAPLGAGPRAAPPDVARGAVRVQRKCTACREEEKEGEGRVQRLCTECEEEEEKLERPGPGDMQATMTVGPPNDAFEQEADGIADRVMRTPTPPGDFGKRPTLFAHRRVQRHCTACAAPIEDVPVRRPFGIQRKCAACHEQEEKGGDHACAGCEEEAAAEARVSRKESSSDGSRAIGGGIAARVHALRGGGQSLPQSARTIFEPRFGHDFSDVRVHTDASAAASARELGAEAYTLGQDIVFGAGRYAPHTAAGQRLLAHELVHTVQQSGGRPLPTGAVVVPTARASGAAAISRAPDPRVQRGLLDELGLDDVCISDICVTDVAYSIGDLGVGGVTIGDLTSPAENLVVDAIDYTGADLSFVGGAIRPWTDLATAGLDFVGVHLRLDGTKITATLDDIELGSLDVPIDLPSFSVPIPLAALPLPPGLVAYVGLRLGIEPKIILSLGPIALRKLHVSADPVGLEVDGGGELSVEAGIAGIAVTRGALEGGILVPEIGSISVEGGLRFTATGVARGGITEGIDINLAPGHVLDSLLGGSLDASLVRFRSNTSLFGALGLKIWLNAYAAARFDNKILCEYIWPGAFWQAGREWGVNLPLSASLGTDGLSIKADPGAATYRDLPFDEIAPKLGEEPPLGLNCLGFKDLLGEYDYEEPTEGIRVCSRPLDFPIWTGLPAARHAFVYDPRTGANYAIREPLLWGNGVTTSCSPKTSASGPPDDVETSRCKPCAARPGAPETQKDRELEVSRCLQSVYNRYPGPNLYRNRRDPDAGGAWGPNSNSFAAAMAACCYEFDRTGLGILPGWDHPPAGPCPTRTVGDTLQWIIGLPDSDSRVFELARLTPSEHSAILADTGMLSELEAAVGMLWPVALRILNGAASADVPMLREATAFEASFYIRQRVPTRPGRHSRVDALRVVVRELEARNILNPSLASWSYVADTSTDATTSWIWQIDPTTNERIAVGPADVEVHDTAFVDVGWLTSTIMHEWVHAVMAREGTPAAAFDDKGRVRPERRARNEVEAYLWEIEHAVGTGVATNTHQLSDLGHRLTTHYRHMSHADQLAYSERYTAAQRRVRRAEAGVPPMTIDEARRIVQQTSAAIEAALARRPGHERDVDAEIEVLRRRRDAALIEVALTDNPAIQVVRPGPSGDYRVPMIDDSGRVRHVHGGILVAWNLGPVPPSAFGTGAQLGSDPRFQGEPMAIAGTAVQGRVHPYPPDVDFDEHLDIAASSAWQAGKIVTNAIIGFVNRNETRGNVEFTNMTAFPTRGTPGRFTRADVLAARDGNTEKFGKIAGAISRLGAGNLNTYWRGWIRDDATRTPRFVAITKVMTIHAENPRTHEVYISSTRFPDINLAFLDEPDAIPRGSVGGWAWVMCCDAVGRWRGGDYLKAAKRAYNYFIAVGDLAGMATLEPLFRTPQARAAQSLSVLDSIKGVLFAGTRILRVEEAREQLHLAALWIEILPAARASATGVRPTLSPLEIGARLHLLAIQLNETPTGLLAPDVGQAKELETLMEDTELHINLPLDAPPAPGAALPGGAAPQATNEGVVTAVVGRLERDVCPADACVVPRKKP